MKRMLIISIPLFLIALGALWAFRAPLLQWISPAPAQQDWSLRASPSSASAPVAEPVADPLVQPSADEAPPLDAVRAPALALPPSATLVMQIAGRTFGQEQYAFTALDDGTVEVFAQGEFSFEVATIPISAGYRQLLHLNARLQPLHYASELKGPFGLGNKEVTIAFDGVEATMASGQQRTQIPLAGADVLLINMFSTFALLPALFEVGAERATFIALDAGGFGRDEGSAEASAYRLGDMTLTQLSDVALTAGASTLQAQRYRLSIDGPQDGYELLFAQGQWIGIQGRLKDEAGGFIVYRSDLFPSGFQAADAGGVGQAQPGQTP